MTNKISKSGTESVFSVMFTSNLCSMKKNQDLCPLTLDPSIFNAVLYNVRLYGHWV